MTQAWMHKHPEAQAWMLVFEGHVVCWRVEAGRAWCHAEEGTIGLSTSWRVGKGVVRGLKCRLPRGEVPL